MSEKSVIKALSGLKTQHSDSLAELMADIEQNVLGYTCGLSSHIKLGTPLPPMLAKSVSSFEMLKKFLNKFESKRVSFEIKYDGERT